MRGAAKGPRAAKAAARPMVSVLMPAYNEGPRIRSNVLAVDRMFKTLGMSYEIVVVDDGSGDWTYEEAKKAARGA